MPFVPKHMQFLRNRVAIPCSFATRSNGACPRSAQRFPSSSIIAILAPENRPSSIRIDYNKLDFQILTSNPINDLARSEEQIHQEDRPSTAKKNNPALDARVERRFRESCMARFYLRAHGETRATDSNPRSSVQSRLPPGIPGPRCRTAG